MITAGTPGGGNHTIKYKNGLSHSHAYTVLKPITLSTGEKLIKMRNPWGAEDYRGDWSDKSTKWTAATKKEVGLVDNWLDGVFYMSLKDYKKSFEETHININPTDMFSSYFLRLDDDGTSAKKCVENTKSTKCRRHELTVKSDVAQTVYV